MPSVTYVKKAQRQYEMIVRRDADGKPVKVPVMGKDGQQKTTKTGRPIFRTVSDEDKTKPKPLRKCDAPGCGKTIEVGTPYKHITPRGGPYGGTQRNRHASCPPWQHWEYSDSLAARLARIAHDARESFGTTGDLEELKSVLLSAADEVRDLAQEKRDAASNIIDGFGHETEQSSELEQTADSLESWADEIETAADSMEERPDETVDCGSCGGIGRRSGDEDDDDGVDECPDCDAGQVDNPEMEDWDNEAAEALDKLDESPV